MNQFFQILSLAPTIAVALLLYDRFIKPVGEAILPKTTASGSFKDFNQEVEELLKKEAF